MSSVNSITPTAEELCHDPREDSKKELLAIHLSNGYHLRNPGKPIKALAESLRCNEGLDFVIAIIADPRCGFERRSNNGDGYFSFSSSQMARWGNATQHSVDGADGYTPLFLAVMYCREDVVRALLAKKADVYAVTMDSKARTLLHFAALYGHTACAALLIAEGADVNAFDRNLYTPLQVATWNGHTSCAELLIDEGVDVNAADWSGHSPLHRAAMYGHTACAELLIAKGADVNAVDDEGRTPLFLASVPELRYLLRKG